MIVTIGEIKMLWHYTNLESINHIMECGFVQARNDWDAFQDRIKKGLSVPFSPTKLRKMAKEKRVIWFSTSENFEGSAIKSAIAHGREYTMKLQEYHSKFIVCRIGVSEKITHQHGYRKAFKEIGLGSAEIARMHNATIAEGGDYKDHYAVFHNIPLSEVIVIQRLNDDLVTWTDLK